MDRKTTRNVSLRKVLSLIPHNKRRRAYGAVASSMILALLDFIGIAVLVPVLLLVLDQETTLSYPFVNRLYTNVGFQSFEQFTIAVCLSVVIILIMKSLLMLAISNSITKYLLSLYKYYSKRMFRTYMYRGLTFIREHNTAQLVNSINGVCLRFTEGVLGQIFSIITGCLLLTMIIAVILCYDPWLILLAMAIFLPLSAIYIIFFRHKMNENGRMENKLFIQQNKTLHETMRGYAEIEINNAWQYVNKLFCDRLKQFSECRRKASLIRTVTGRIAEFSLIVGIVAMIIIGLSANIPMDTLKMSLGIFAVAAYKIVPSVNRIVNCWMEYKRNSFAAEQIEEAINDDTDKNTNDTSAILPFKQAITFDRITFRYAEDARTVIENFSLTIRKGETIGIKGTSGAGKSTLLNLLCGFFKPTNGEITIDGIRLTPDNRRQWQNNLAYVSQDVFITDTTIAENIAFGKMPDEIDRHRLAKAINAASLSEFITTLPYGVDTVTGEGGCKLSGGQRQRIGIARALYRQAAILLFDEATSSLDSNTEADIMQAIKQLSAEHGELTIIIISHREHTLDFCDRIIELSRHA